MEFVVSKEIRFNKNRGRRIGEFLYDEQEDSIFFDLPHLFPCQLKITAWDKVEVTPWFNKLPTVLRGHVNSDFICKNLLAMECINSDKILIHGSCVDWGHKAHLFVGFPQSGKTYSTYTARNKGAKLISEEHTIVDASTATAHPYKKITRSCFSADTLHAAEMEISTKEEVELYLKTIRAKLLPFLYEAVIWKNIEVSGDLAKVDKILYGSTTEEVNYRELTILTENEYPFFTEPILQAYAYAKGIDLFAYQYKQRQLIKEFVDAVNRNT